MHKWQAKWRSTALSDNTTSSQIIFTDLDWIEGGDRNGMADRRGAVFPLIFFIYLILQPTLQPARPAFQNARFDDTPTIEQVVAEEQRQLAEVGNSTWDPEFGHQGHLLNVTGLESDRGFAWEALPTVRARAAEQLEYALGDWGKSALEEHTGQSSPVPLYQNTTGRIQGKWRRSALQQQVPIPQLNLTRYAPQSPLGRPPIARPFERNITGGNGHVTIRFGEQEPTLDKFNDTIQVAIEVDIADTESYDEHTFTMYGVYFTDLGHAIFTTTSRKLGGIFALPHFALSASTFERSRFLLNDSILETVKRQEDGTIEKLNPWRSRSEANEEEIFSLPKCDLIVYMQQMEPVTTTLLPSDLLHELERELRFPSGARLPSPPAMRFSMLMFSPDCGFVLESQGPPFDIPQDGDHLTGPKVEVQHKQSRHHILVFSFALALQMYLLMRQMREASTPSTRSRISLYTVAMLAFGDGLATMAFLSISLMFPGVWVNFVATGFLAFLSVAFFSMRFISDIWQVQAPERERRIRAELEEEQEIERRLETIIARIRAERVAREQTQTAAEDTAPTAAAEETALTTESNVNNSTADQTVPGAFPAAQDSAARPIDTGATPVPFYMPSDQGGLLPMAQEPLNARTTDAIVASRMPSFLSAYVRFYALMVFILIFSGTAASWPSPIRRVYFTILGLLYLSFWIPQIIRNIQRNCRHALNWDFVVGQSVLRLVPFAYFYAFKDNVLSAGRDYPVLAILAVWLWIQVVLLGSQELVGPRWFIRSTWAPPAYDYHPVLRDDEEGATMPIGFSQATAAAADTSLPSSPTQERKGSMSLQRRASIPKETKEKGKRIFDCAVCMQDLEVPVIEAGAPADSGGLAGNLLARRTYMVTPCRHIFHSNCLESWMKHRLQCPICRETLPPL